MGNSALNRLTTRTKHDKVLLLKILLSNFLPNGVEATQKRQPRKFFFASRQNTVEYITNIKVNSHIFVQTSGCTNLTSSS